VQTYLLAAALVAVLVGVVHSALGEMLIFRKLRKGTIIPDQPAAPLELRNVRILWATWHLATALGLGFAAILFFLANRDRAPDPAIAWPLILSFAAGSVLVMAATRGKHPGWIGLLIVSVLTYLGMSNRQDR
jgi:ABC-type Mn2+/Zn2+ transport system permease subunit